MKWWYPKKQDSKFSLIISSKFTDITRRKFTAKFKTKVVLEALKEQSSLAELAQKHDIHPQQISTWKRGFLQKADSVFANGSINTKSEAEQEKDRLLKTIGQLKVENGFLKNALR
jgi:transposase